MQDGLQHLSLRTGFQNPKGISMKESVVFGCALTTAYGAIYNDANLRERSTFNFRHR